MCGFISDGSVRFSDVECACCSVQIFEGYGQTECTAGCTFSMPGDWSAGKGLTLTMGKLSTYIWKRLVRDTHVCVLVIL